MKIIANKKECLKILRENREKHVSEHAKRLLKYEVDLKDLELKADEPNQDCYKGFFKQMDVLALINRKPISYHDRYDVFIEMLEMHPSTDVELDVSSWKKIFKDEWEY